MWPEVAIDPEIAEQVEIELKYEGYIKRQQQQVGRSKHLEEKRIPEGFRYERVVGLSREVLEKLAAVAPQSLGQASRISGVSPSDIGLVMVWMKRFRQRDDASKTVLGDGSGPEDGPDDSRGCSC